jgi:hypothetical protein
MVDPRADEPVADVLAAEEFGVPAADAAFRLRSEPANDVLAAEEFGVPAPDPALHHENLALPADLVGAEPRDVLVAEEFAMPAPDEARVRPRAAIRRGLPAGRLLAVALPVLSAGGYLLRRWRRRRAQRPLARTRRFLRR